MIKSAVLNRITARESADEALNESVRFEAKRISDLEKATSKKDTELTGRLDAEKQSREQADNELKDWSAHTDARILEIGEFLQEQADILAAELQQANISSWKKTRELDAEDKRLYEEIRDTEQKLHTEGEQTAAAIRQEMQNDAAGLGRNFTRRDEHLQEQADETGRSCGS